MGSTRTLEVERSTSTAHRLAHYDGACGCVHGHNMKWQVEVEVKMNAFSDDNMPLDFKDVSNRIDKFDHGIVLNANDALLDALDESDDDSDEDMMAAEGEPFTHPYLGKTILFTGDPTCEVLSEHLRQELLGLNPVVSATVSVAETDKYTTVADGR